MTWTKERVSLLIDLWTSGKSASIVAKEIGSVSRNAVIGKIHRLGISNRIHIKKALPTSKLKKMPLDKLKIKAQRATVKTASGQKTSLEKQSLAKIKNTLSKKSLLPRTQAKRVILAHNPDVPIELKKISLLELREDTCRWPSGDPKNGDFYFCGCPSRHNSPYCEYHARIAYTQATKRDPKREAKQFIIVEQKPSRGSDDFNDNFHIDILSIKKNPDENVNFL